MLKTIALTTSALALSATWTLAETIEVPASAKKLDAAGIEALYAGLHASFNNVSQKDTLTGEVWVDQKVGNGWGMYVYGGKNRGVFVNKMRIKGDQFCYKGSGDKKETCSDVYADGKSYYETDAKKKVLSANQVLDPGIPALPATAKKATPEEFAAAFNGKSLFVTVYDMGKPVIAYAKWDTKKKRVTGDAIVGNKKAAKFVSKYTVKDDTICFKDNGPKQNCRSYLIDGDSFYEVNADGTLHGKSVAQ